MPLARRNAVTAGAVGAALLLCLGVPAVADGLMVQVTTVEATPDGQCDPLLEHLRPRLRKVAGYSSYRALGDERRKVDWRHEEAFQLPGGRSLVLWPKEMRDQRVVMQVRLLEGQRRLVDTQVRLQNRGFMIFGLGRDARLGSGATLILLRAEK